MEKVFQLIVLLFLQVQILGQNAHLPQIEITADNILINNNELFDSSNVFLINNINSEQPKISFYYPSKKTRWQKTVFTKTGIEFYQIVDTTVKSNAKSFILFKILADKISSVKINNKVLNLKTLTCEDLDSMIDAVFVDNFYPHNKNSDMTASNGKYLLKFHFKRCKTLEYIILNCPIK